VFLKIFPSFPKFILRYFVNQDPELHHFSNSLLDNRQVVKQVHIYCEYDGNFYTVKYLQHSSIKNSNNLM